MATIEIIAAVLLILAAIGFLVATFADANLIWLGAAVILGAAGVLLLDRGWHSENAKFAAKHAAIVSDLRAQGYPIEDDQVNARGGWSYPGTEADLALGGCLVPFIVTKVDGQWKLALPAAHSGPTEPVVRVLSPADVAKIAAACP